ncbi:hypothetical protein FA95DRAFT_1684413 [Auriscalpium vulgare]|uniref:Uncharacterized protein n=1 Tax=Auriscalpium vulgare TaxID=40419 RepID=A0ACB8R6E4_9AGAM|nr:hypothetical protein FA95DRAFT_1684413 [Auriscalpium vulgare]
MSFQNFRLDGVSVQHIPLQTQDFVPQPLPAYPAPVTAISPAPTSSENGGPRNGRGPYGSGDMDDGYTLVFDNMDAFQAWRAKEEEEKVVEFVKGDTHGSKAVPPRFKDHVKLVCARHSRSGRKKYVKKFPDRVRKVPSRKLDGKGCNASMSYKTYFETDEIRVCYISQHSHEIGVANLPFTRRGRRAMAAGKRVDGGRLTEDAPHNDPEGTPPAGLSSSISGALGVPPQASSSGLHMPHASTPQESNSPPMRAHPPEHPVAFASPYPHFPSMSMPAPPGLGSAIPLQQHTERERLERERWDRLDVLYQSIRNNARHFEYPPPSVAALESVLMRMYFESPLPGPQAPFMASQPVMAQNGHPMASPMRSGSASGEEEEG